MKDLNPEFYPHGKPIPVESGPSTAKDPVC